MSFGNNSDSWYTVSEAMGCGTSGSGEQSVACMRTKNFKDILQTVWNVGASENLLAGFRISFGPYIDNYTVFSDYDTRAAAGNFIHKVCPTLSGDFSHVYTS